MEIKLRNGLKRADVFGSRNSSGTWVDGPFVAAMRRGEELVIVGDPSSFNIHPDVTDAMYIVAQNRFFEVIPSLEGSSYELIRAAPGFKLTWRK